MPKKGPFRKGQHAMRLMTSKATLILALLMCFPAHSQDSLVGLLAPFDESDQLQVLNNLQQDYVECTAYFFLLSGALQKKGEADLADEYQQSLTLTMSKANQLGGSIGISENATSARLEMAMELMRGKINDNFNNMSILLNEHRKPCKQIVDSPLIRVEHWINTLDLQ
jgi:hypothetical protein